MKAILNFLQIQREMIFGDAPILIQDMFRMTPKTFNAIDEVVCSLRHQGFCMIHRMMFAVAFQ